MEILGVEINGQDLLPEGGENSTDFYRAFMRHCIYNYFDRIIISDTLQKKFRLSPLDPDFRRAIVYGRVEGYFGLYFSNWNDTKRKKAIIEAISDELGIDVHVHYVEE